jgi:predicted nucleic acid-binding protein
VSNTSCLIAIETIGRLDLLPQLYQELVIPPAVSSEWGTAPPPWLRVLGITNPALVQSLRLQLGAGEAEAIALAVETSASRLILDDQRARNVAVSLQLTITGTVGIILRAKQRSIVPLVRPIFDDLRKGSFWLSPSLYQQAPQMAGE